MAPRSEAGRIPALDGMRALAILGVVTLHIAYLSGALAAHAGTAWDVIAWGALGFSIDVFFIIGGFLLFLPMVAREGRAGKIGDYAMLRAARLLPAYLLSLAITLVLLVTVPLPPLAFAPAGYFPGAAEILAHVGAVQMPAKMFGEIAIGFGVNGPLWMVSVVAAFYVLLPLLSRPYCRHPFLGLALAALITVGWREGVTIAEGLLEGVHASDLEGRFVQLAAVDQFPGWTFAFGLGMTGAWLYDRKLDRSPPPGGLPWAMPLAVAGLLGWVVCGYLYGEAAAELNAPFSGSVARLDSALVVAYTAAQAAFIAAVVAGPEWLRRPFAGRTLRWCADLSYGVYVIHWVVGLYVANLLIGLPGEGSPGDLLLWTVAVLPVSFAYAWASLRFVERPILRRVRARLRRDDRGLGRLAPAARSSIDSAPGHART